MALLHPQVEAFLAILETGSFEAAAKQLFVTPPAVSQRIRQLEEHLGTLLIERVTPARPTPAGERLLQNVRPMRQLEDEVLASLSPDMQSGPARLSLALPADWFATRFFPLVRDFAARHDVRFEIITDDQDHSLERLRKGDVMGTVTSEEHPLQGCRSFSIGSLHYLAVATPDFAARWFPDGLTREALKVAPVIAGNRKDALQHRFAKQTVGDDFELPEENLHFFSSVEAVAEAVRRGFGWSLVPEEFFGPDLVDLAPGRLLEVPLYWQTTRICSGLVAELTDELRRRTRPSR